MDTTDSRETSSALTQIISVMDALDPPERERVLTTLSAYYRRSSTPSAHGSPDVETPPTRVPAFGQEAKEPKGFIKDKGPRTDVERVACLAFYLAKYRDLPYLKTQDLTKLNTEAAQPQFSNASNSAANALKMGYLAAGPKGQRQISAFGEEFVTALPDRDAPKEVSNTMRPKRRPRKRPANPRDGQESAPE